MREMKESGLSWVPFIPKEWKKARLKDVIDVLTDYTANGSFADLAKNVEYHDYEDFARLVRLSDLRENLDNDGVYVNQESYEYLRKSKLFGGEILVANVGAYAGLFCEMPKPHMPSTLGPNMFLIRPNSLMNAHFLYYLGNAHFVYEQLVQKAISSAQPKLNKTDIKTTYIFIPPIEEQVEICKVLDFQCGKIDKILTALKHQIRILEEYKRSTIAYAVSTGVESYTEWKDSSVAWLGKIPAHWDCIRGKYVLEYVQKPIREDDGVITCFRDGEVTLRSNRREDGFTMADKEIGYQGIDVSDLVVHGMDGFAGAIGISDSRGKASPVLNVLDTKHNKRFIMYYLRSLAYNDVFLALATGIRVRSCDLRWNKLSELQYPIPPKEEQDSIVEHIDTVIKKVDGIISNKQKQLDEIEAYKKSLIFDYVTGKKEVPADA